MLGAASIIEADHAARNSSDASSRARTTDAARIANVTRNPAFVTPCATSRARASSSSRSAIARATSEASSKPPRPPLHMPIGGVSSRLRGQLPIVAVILPARKVAHGL